jgi:hypothetical protein
LQYQHPSLEALVGIANSPTLAPYLSEVLISTHKLPDGYELAPNAIQQDGTANYVSRDMLIGTGQAHHMLIEAFAKLPNLQTVGLRDYDGAGRLRDGTLMHLIDNPLSPKCDF